MKIILASASPRRKELLSYITKDFEVIVSDADETFENGLDIKEQSKRLAYIKAKAIFDKTTGDRIVIGSDTMVLKDNKVYGKPKDRKDAIQMISELQDNVHEVITSLCVLVEENQNYKEYIDYDISKVYIGKVSRKETEEWINTGKAMDKAGAYAMQEEFGKFIEKIDGNHTTIIGLPVHKLYKILKQYLEK